MGECPTVVRAQDTGGAHRKHFAHPLDARRVEAQRLIERLRELPSHTEGNTRCGARGARCMAGRRAWGGGPSGTCARGEPDSRLGTRARAERTANILFMVVTLDVSKFSG